MKLSAASISRSITTIGVTHPVKTIAAILGALFLLLSQAATLASEVGYASYFGPSDPKIARLQSYLAEFHSGIHLLVVFSCRDTDKCESVGEAWTLEYLNRLQARLEEAPHVRGTWSILNTPIVTGPLQAETLLSRSSGGVHSLHPEWPKLFHRASQQGFVLGSVLSDDSASAGIVVELDSVQSVPVREAVHAIMDLLPAFEEELGASLYTAGDPVWTVYSADSLNSDSSTLTVVMFVVMLLLLWGIFRDASLAILPVITVGVLYGCIQGLTAVLGIPLTSVLTALPPMLVTIAIAISIHFLTSFVQGVSRAGENPYTDAAEHVGPGCFWSTCTTALGVGSFVLSDLTTFQHFGILASIGLLLAFFLTFALLPSLLVLRSRFGSWSPPEHRSLVPSELLSAAHGGVTRSPALVLAISISVVITLGAGNQST